MKKVLCDTDILSVFAKVERLRLLETAFPNADLVIIEAVYDELEYAEQNGFQFPEKIFQATNTISLKEEELEKYRDKRDQPKFLPLSKADLKSFVVAQNREITLISNDNHLLEVSDQQNILSLGIYDILELLYRRGELDKNQIKELAEEIKEKDNLDLPHIDKIGENKNK